MERKDSDRLFEYLKSILYDTQIEPLDLSKLDESSQKLGRGLQFLQKAVEEMQEYSGNLSQGRLSCAFPGRDNFLCNNLKNLHANLNHLTWQAQQVAGGDYSQHVSYLGEFSEAFNTMTAQLQQREAYLKEQAERLRQKAEVIESYNQLILELTNRRREQIVAVNEETREVLYCNRCTGERQDGKTFCNDCDYKLPVREKLLEYQGSHQHHVWEWSDGTHFYRINTMSLEWQGMTSWVHILQEISSEKRLERRLESKAYHDSMTGIYNRRFFGEYVKRMLEQQMDFLLGYIDLDNLKGVNDHFGHSEGDRYLRSLVKILRVIFRSTDIVARIGGDEFCIILENCSMEVAEEKMRTAQKLFLEESGEYLNNFSYGLIAVKGRENTLTAEEILSRADRAMYECKRKNKKNREKI